MRILTAAEYDGANLTEEGMALDHRRKIAAQLLLLTAGVAMAAYGAWRGEAALVLGKAIKLCLECVGIG